MIVILWKMILLRQQRDNLLYLICRVLLWKILNKEPKQKRLKTSDTHAPAHGVGHDPALFGQHIALCSDGELDMYMKEIQKRRDAIVDAAASGVLIGDFEAEVPDV